MGAPIQITAEGKVKIVTTGEVQMIHDCPHAPTHVIGTIVFASTDPTSGFSTSHDFDDDFIQLIPPEGSGDCYRDFLASYQVTGANSLPVGIALQIRVYYSAGSDSWFSEAIAIASQPPGGGNFAGASTEEPANIFIPPGGTEFTGPSGILRADLIQFDPNPITFPAEAGEVTGTVDLKFS